MVRFLDLVNDGEKPYGHAFPDAVQRLADLAGVPVPEATLSAETIAAARQREARRSILGAVAQHAQERLWSEAGAPVRAYLHTRGLDDDQIEDFGLGWYESTAAVERALEQQGHDLATARDLAVLWPKLEGYVLIPWADGVGQPLTLYGRWPAKTPSDGRPKTIALPGEGSKATPFCYDRARRAGHKELVLVEGVLDALVLQALGDTRVVACVAAQLSTGQVETLRAQRIRSVTICLDPDAGGDRGVLSCIRNLGQAGIAAYVAPRLPDGLDPDEFVLRDGVEAWDAHIKRAETGAVFRARQVLGDITPTSPAPERRAAVERVLALDGELRGPSVARDREDILRLAAELTGYSYDALGELVEAHETRREREEQERALASALQKATAAQGKQDIHAVIRDLSTALTRLTPRLADEPPPFSVDRLDTESALVPAGKSCGLAVLDAVEVRLAPGEEALVAARTGHGKTSFLVTVFVNLLAQSAPDELIVFYSFEEPEVRIYHRLLAVLMAQLGNEQQGWSVSEIAAWLRNPLAQRPDVDVPNLSALDDAKARLRGWEDRLQLVYRPAWSVTDLAAHARRLAEERPLGTLCVDYLQRIPPPADGAFDRRDIEVSQVARALKALAVDVAAPVLVGAQINRQAVAEAGKLPSGDYRDADVQETLRARRPKLHQLREGGSEQEADLVLGLMNYAADYEQDREAPTTHLETVAVPPVTRLDVGVLKSRYGRQGSWAKLAFHGRSGLIRDPYAHDEI
jgi:replicative DNA helicase